MLNTFLSVRSRSVFLAVALVASIATAGGEGDPPVKKSRSGVCHAASGPSYGRTKNFEPFDSLEACLGSGGRMPKN